MHKDREKERKNKMSGNEHIWKIYKRKKAKEEKEALSESNNWRVGRYLEGRKVRNKV